MKLPACAGQRTAGVVHGSAGRRRKSALPADALRCDPGDRERAESPGLGCELQVCPSLAGLLNH